MPKDIELQSALRYLYTEMKADSIRWIDAYANLKAAKGFVGVPPDKIKHLDEVHFQHQVKIAMTANDWDTFDQLIAPGLLPEARGDHPVSIASFPELDHEGILAKAVLLPAASQLANLTDEGGVGGSSPFVDHIIGAGDRLGLPSGVRTVLTHIRLVLQYLNIFSLPSPLDDGLSVRRQHHHSFLFCN